MLTIAVLAGRRIDATGATSPRFPLVNASLVKSRLDELFADLNISSLVCSAACGADLLALAAAQSRNIATTIILPFDDKIFLRTSVIDRPGDWAAAFFTAIKYAEVTGRVIVLSGDPKQENAYDDVTLQLFKTVADLDCRKVAIAVWEKKPRGKGDATEDFVNKAAAYSIPVYNVLTTA